MSDLGRRIGFTIGALLVFRLGTHVPIPGIEPEAWKQIFGQQDILGMFNLLSGGGVERMAIFALGILPYLTAALLLQLASVVMPTLQALPRQGEGGRRRLDTYTLVLTLILALVQSLGIAFGLESAGNVVADPGLLFRLTTMFSMAGGTIFLVWLAGQITSRGIGNGLALILAAGIVAELPAAIAATLELGRRNLLSTNLILGVFLFAAALTALIVQVELARRRLLVTFPRRQVGVRTIEGQSHLQLKLNGAGIIPATLASWLLLVPFWAVTFLAGEESNWASSYLGSGRPLFLILYALAIVLCVFLYTAFLLDPDEIAESLKQHGGAIAGVEPGEATAKHIDYVISRINVVGAVYLVFLCLIPEILVAHWRVPFYLGGTSLLIVVCAILDLKAQLERAR